MILKRTTAIRLMILAAIFWGLNGLFVRNIDSLSSLGISAGRLLLAAIPFFLWGLLKKSGRQEYKRSLKHWKQLVVLGFLLGINFIFSIWSYTLTKIAVAQTLNSIAMFFTIIFAPFFLKEKVSKRDMIFMIVAFLGISLIFGIDASAFDSRLLFGDMIALTASAITAIYGITVRKFKIQLPFYVTMGWIFFGGFLWILLISILLGIPLIIGPFNSTSILNLAALSLLGTFLGHTILNVSLHTLRAEKATTIALSSAVWAYFVGLFFFDEALSLPIIAGIALTLFGIYGVITSHHPKEIPEVVK